MNPEQCDEVRANAKYLRRVRPIDPEEIREYVPDRPHPAAVRRTLRESAVDLGLIERTDGAFVPVPDDPVAPSFDGVAAFPERYARALEGLLVDRYGTGWPDGESGDRLRERIRRLKAEYFAGERVAYEYETALAYAIYHLPDYYAAVQYVLAPLAADGLLGRRLRVLDVGAGVGGPALGLADFLPEDALVAYHAVEPSAAADVLEAMLDEVGRNFHPTIHRTAAEAFDPADEYDLLLFANVLSELDEPHDVAERYLDALAPDGSLVALAPADRETSIDLRGLERALVDRNDGGAGGGGAGSGDTDGGNVDGGGTGSEGDRDAGERSVYAPTVRLWPDHTPTDRGWSFDVRPDIETPPFQRRLDAAGGGEGTFVNVDVQFSYFVLRTDGERRIDLTPDHDRWAKLADSEHHVGERVDLLAAKLSRSLSGETGNPLFKVGDGSEAVDHFAVLTRETALNGDLLGAAYGDPLAFENVLVLWNEDEGAYNLVVDDETIVDRLPAV